MAISVATAKPATSSQTHATGTTTFTTASVTPTANRLLVLAIGTLQAAVSAVSGCGLTWTQIGLQTNNTRTNVWAAWTGDSPSSGAITITMAAKEKSICYTGFEIIGGYYDGNVNNCFKQRASESHNASASAAGVLPNSFQPGSMTFYVMTNNTDSTANLTAERTSIANVATTNTGSRIRFGAQYYLGEDLSITFSWTGSITGGGIVYEFLEARSEFPRTTMILQD